MGFVYFVACGLATIVIVIGMFFVDIACAAPLVVALFSFEGTKLE